MGGKFTALSLTETTSESTVDSDAPPDINTSNLSTSPAVLTNNVNETSSSSDISTNITMQSTTEETTIATNVISENTERQLELNKVNDETETVDVISTTQVMDDGNKEIVASEEQPPVIASQVPAISEVVNSQGAQNSTIDLNFTEVELNTLSIDYY